MSADTPEKPAKGGANLARWPRGADLTARVIRESGADRRALVSFSCGKDAVAVALAIRDDMDLYPFYGEIVPGLSFVEEALSYYERKLFNGRRIIRAPHKCVNAWLNALSFQTPERIRVIQGAQLEAFDWPDLQDTLKEQLGLPEACFTATGLRAADSVLRRTHFSRSGPINRRKRTWAPVWDWMKGDVIEALRRSGVGLPVDYRLFGRTFDGLEARYLIPIKKHFPADYRRILEVFPLAEASVFQAEMLWGTA